MKFEKFGATVAITATVLAGSLFGAESASALGVGDVLRFSTHGPAIPSNQATLTDDMSDGVGGLFNFDAGVLEIDGLLPTFAPGPLSDRVIQLQQLTATTYELVGTDVEWLFGLDDEMGGTTRTFNLTSFTLAQVGNSGFNFAADYSGFFRPPYVGAIGGTTASGRLTGSTGASISGTIEVVPTPAAVLPGLIGMATAAYRKKKQEEDSELAIVEAEAQA